MMFISFLLKFNTFVPPCSVVNSPNISGSIPLHKISVVEEVGVDSLEQSGFAFQIVHNSTSLYIIAGQQVERVNWLAKLRELISCNK